jgi:hypothetical protein
MSRFYGPDGIPSFTHLSITFSNQRFSNCNPPLVVGFVKLTSDTFCGNSLHDEYLVLWSPMLQQLCDFSNQSPMYDELFLSLLISAYCSPALMFPPNDSCMVTTLETVTLNTRNKVAVFVTDAPVKGAPTFYHLSKPDKSPIFRFFTWTVTQHYH